MNELKSKKFNFSNLWENDRFLKILSVVVAFLAWFIISITIDTNASATIKKIPVEIELENTAAENTAAENSGLDVIDTETRYVDISIRGKSYEIGRLGPEDFTATLSLEEVTKPGTYTLNVLVNPTKDVPKDVTISSINTPTLEVQFDRILEKTFPLEASAVNVQAADGYIFEGYTVSPKEITVRGPASVIEKISKCVVENTDKMILSSSVAIDGELIFLDASNNEIDAKYLQYYNNEFKISIPLYKKVTLPLTFDYINVPEGIDTSKIHASIEPKEIEVAIPVDAAAGIEEISVGQVDFRKLDIEKTISAEISLLSGYINLDEVNEATIDFGLSSDRYQKALLSSDNIVLKNVPSEYEVSVITEKIADIPFVGENAVIEGLTSSDVLITADFSNISNLKPGEQRVPVTITVLNNKQAWAVAEKSIFVSVTKKS